MEIAGKAGTDLNGFTLQLYNGSGGATYNTLNLTGVLTDDSNNYGTLLVNLPVNGLQNGAPDGLALVDPLDSVVQFLSYEGSFTATNGAANGQTSTDIGIAETSSTPAGFSLQLIGAGSDYSDFTWSGPATASPGSINTGQTFPRKSVPDNGSTAWMLILGLSGLAFVRRGRRYSKPPLATASRYVV